MAYLTYDAFLAFGTTAQTTFDTAKAGGATDTEAYQAILPLLTEMVRASEMYGYQLTEQQQAMIDAAREAGVNIPIDTLNAQVGLLTQIRDILSGQKTTTGPPGGPPPTGPPGTTPPGTGGPPYKGGTDGFDSGGIASGPQSGYYAVLHGTEMVVPMDSTSAPHTTSEK